MSSCSPLEKQWFLKCCIFLFKWLYLFFESFTYLNDVLWSYSATVTSLQPPGAHHPNTLPNSYPLYLVINNLSPVISANMTQVCGHPLGHGHCICSHITKRDWLPLPLQQSTTKGSSPERWGSEPLHHSPEVWLAWSCEVTTTAVPDMCSSRVKSRSLRFPFLLICQLSPSFLSTLPHRSWALEGKSI